jgi:hypothetical protein
MKIFDLVKAIEDDVKKIERFNDRPIKEVIETILKLADKHGKDLSRRDLFTWVKEMRDDDPMWKIPMVLRVKNLEEAIREAMIVKACNTVQDELGIKVKP